MIAEMYVKYFSKKLRVVIYPKKYTEEGVRTYDNPSKATRKRLENEILNHAPRIYFRKNGVSVWVKRQ